jgi:hypothetical protein
MTVELAVAVIALWDTKQYCTAEIAGMPGVHESDVERCVHIRREAARGVA